MQRVTGFELILQLELSGRKIAVDWALPQVLFADCVAVSGQVACS